MQHVQNHGAKHLTVQIDGTTDAQCELHVRQLLVSDADPEWCNVSARSTKSYAYDGWLIVAYGFSTASMVHLDSFGVLCWEIGNRAFGHEFQVV